MEVSMPWIGLCQAINYVRLMNQQFERFCLIPL